MSSSYEIPKVFYWSQGSVHGRINEQARDNVMMHES